MWSAWEWMVYSVLQHFIWIIYLKRDPYDPIETIDTSRSSCITFIDKVSKARICVIGKRRQAWSRSGRHLNWLRLRLATRSLISFRFQLFDYCRCRLKPCLICLGIGVVRSAVQVGSRSARWGHLNSIPKQCRNVNRQLTSRRTYPPLRHKSFHHASLLPDVVLRTALLYLLSRMVALTARWRCNYTTTSPPSTKAASASLGSSRLCLANATHQLWRGGSNCSRKLHTYDLCEHCPEMAGWVESAAVAVLLRH